MLGRCPRCGKSRPLALDGTPSSCTSCGLVGSPLSGAPPAEVGLLEPFWAPALLMCMGVSSLVFAFALLAARLASPSPVAAEDTHPACVSHEGVTPSCEATASW